MVEFNLWKEAFIFATLYSFGIIVACFFVTKLGCKMIEQLGVYPSKTPIIQMSIFLKLVVLEILTFIYLIVFFQIYSVKL